MKITIPAELKASVPQSTWGKILTATPVIMTVLATMLAGLASSEMTRAQYDRSLAAQQQSKAGDQWSYFQAKRLRAALQRNTLDMLQVTTPSRPFKIDTFKEWIMQKGQGANEPGAATLRQDFGALLESPDGQRTLAALAGAQLPEVSAAAPENTELKAALGAIEAGRPESQITPLVIPLRTQVVDEALRAAIDRAQFFDQAVQPVTKTIDRIERIFSETGVAPDRDFTFARMRFSALRYDAEARLNQAIANLYELQVRQSNLAAERHHRRSQRFFFGMLGAQAAVIIATFSIAAQQRSLLWALAAAAGLAAIGFAVYVYFYI